MFLLTTPSDEQIANALLSQRDLPFTYQPVGMTCGTPPDSFVVDHNRVQLGAGEAVFQAARAALNDWKQFETGWMRLYRPETGPAEGAIVGILARLPVVSSLSVCRVVYTFDEDGPTRRVGFAYGTLPDHIARGEERFTIEWRHDDDTVWYDILACSRPAHPLAIAGYPVVRLFQKRFARDSKRAMLRATRAG